MHDSAARAPRGGRERRVGLRKPVVVRRDRRTAYRHSGGRLAGPIGFPKAHPSLRPGERAVRIRTETLPSPAVPLPPVPESWQTTTLVEPETVRETADGGDEIERRVLAMLDGLGLPYEVHRIDPAFADTAAYCEQYGSSLEHAANTIILASKKEPRH